MVQAPLLALVSVVAMGGAGECRPPKDSSEAKLLAYFAAPIAFSPAGNAGPMAPGAIRLSFDLTYVPTPSADIRRASFCQRKSENTNLSPIFPRPRLAVGLPGGFYVEGSYLPPVTVLDATPNLGSLALGWTRSLRGGVAGSVVPDPNANTTTWLAVRAHATIGSVKGAITCSDEAIQNTNPSRVCYGNEPSNDRYQPNMFGLEAMLGWTGGGRWSGYVGGGYTSIRPRFDVNFLSLNGVLDDTRVLLDDGRITAFAGGRLRVTARTAVTAELYSVPQDVTTFRLGGSWTPRSRS